MEVNLAENIKRLLSQVGEPGRCKGCGAPIWWVVHRNGRRAPCTEQGLNHFADCPQAGQFRSSGK